MASIKERSSLVGRTALVTGGAGHIGSKVAGALAEMGAAIAVVDLNAESCERAAAGIRESHGTPAAAFACDLSDEAAVRAAPAAVESWRGSLDVIVHTAAFVGTTNVAGWAAPFEEQTVDAWDRAIRVNLTSAFVLAQAAHPLLKRSSGASIVMIGSIYGLVAPDMRLYDGTTMANPAGYAASKGGLLQLTRYLASLMAPEVRVNMVSPGGVWRGQPEVFRERYVNRTPLRAMATEDDITGAVVYLATGLSSYVTGSNLIVDGGWTIW